MPAAAQKTVRLASDDWCPFVCADEQRLISGYLVDAANDIFGASGRQVESVFLPLNRAERMVEQGAIDGIYAPALDNRLELSKPLAMSRACFYTAPDSKWTYTGLESLKGVAISVIDDYGYDGGSFDDYLLKAKKDQLRSVQFRTGKTAGERGVKMMVAGRIPILVEHEAVAAYLLKLQGESARLKIRQAGCLATSLPLVIGIGKNNPEAAEFIHAINTGIANLQSSGRIVTLKKKYGLAY
ncbi:transporter substrate-binding domain-containing protein [Oxalobacteraceae bacterium]|nr:transporter substrate-binding domain-containing protein [Oxalobacteraceae bacterium]